MPRPGANCSLDKAGDTSFANWFEPDVWRGAKERARTIVPRVGTPSWHVPRIKMRLRGIFRIFNSRFAIIEPTSVARSSSMQSILPARSAGRVACSGQARPVSAMPFFRRSGRSVQCSAARDSEQLQVSADTSHFQQALPLYTWVGRNSAGDLILLMARDKALIGFNIAAHRAGLQSEGCVENCCVILC